MYSINDWIVVKQEFYGAWSPKMCKVKLLPESVLQIRGRVRGGFKCSMVSRSRTSYTFILSEDTLRRCCRKLEASHEEEELNLVASMLTNLKLYDFI